MRYVLVLLAASALLACKRAPSPNASAGDESLRDAGTASDASSIVPRSARVVRLVGAAMGCVELESGVTKCLERPAGFPTPKDFAPSTWHTFGAGKVVEVASSCWRNDRGEAACEGGAGEPLRQSNVRSLAAHPLALDTSGNVKLAWPEVSRYPEESAQIDVNNRRWTAIASALVSTKAIAAHGFAGCAQDTNGTIRCWADLTCMAGAQGNLPIQIVRDAAGAQEMFVAGWQTLCVRDAGAVRCSTPLPDAELCAPRGEHKRCGKAGNTGGGPQQLTLAEAGYDACTAIGRAMAPVPDLAGVVRIAPYAHIIYYELDAGRVHLNNIEDGGCAELESGAISCFDPMHCGKAKARAWTTRPVTGLPPGRPSRWVVGANEGYVAANDGKLYVWNRLGRDEADCAASPQARRLDIPEPVVDVVAGYVPISPMPGYNPAGCALTKSGNLWCWSWDFYKGTRAAPDIVKVDFEAR